MTLEELFVWAKDAGVDPSTPIRVNIDRRPPAVPWSFGISIESVSELAVVLRVGPNFDLEAVG